MFLFNNVFLQLICLLPFFCLFSPWNPLFSRQGAYCWVPNNVFPLSDSRVSGRAYCMTVTYFARFVFTFCIEWDHGSSFWDVRCHFASHACLLVASCCLPDPLNAPLCSYVDMAPSAVGHCPFCVSAEVRFVSTSVLNLTDLTSDNNAVGQKTFFTHHSAGKAIKMVIFPPSHCLLSAVGKPAWRTRCSPVLPRLLLPKGKPSLQESRMGLRQVPIRSPRAGASMRKIGVQSTPSESGETPHAKTQRVRELHTLQQHLTRFI